MIKKTLIILISFFLILWIQNVDDRKNKRVRKSLYDKYKMPLLVSSIVGLVITLNFNKNIFEQIIDKKSNKVTISDVDLQTSSANSAIKQPVEIVSTIPVTKPEVPEVPELPASTADKLVESSGIKNNFKSDITDQNVYTDLANF